MNGTKNVFKSTGVWGGIIALTGAAAPVVGNLVGLDVSPADVNAVFAHLDKIMVAFGSLIAIWGRITARKQIG